MPPKVDGPRLRTASWEVTTHGFERETGALDGGRGLPGTPECDLVLSQEQRDLLALFGPPRGTNGPEVHKGSMDPQGPDSRYTPGCGGRAELTNCDHDGLRSNHEARLQLARGPMPA